MADLRKPRHDERLEPCPICGGEPWADSKNGTIYCDCGLRYHINGECNPEWHRMDWTADEWNRLANVSAENARLRELARDYDRALSSMYALCDCDFVPLNDATLLALRSRMHDLGIEVE